MKLLQVCSFVMTVVWSQPTRWEYVPSCLEGEYLSVSSGACKECSKAEWTAFPNCCDEPPKECKDARARRMNYADDEDDNKARFLSDVVDDVVDDGADCWKTFCNGNWCPEEEKNKARMMLAKKRLP